MVALLLRWWQGSNWDFNRDWAAASQLWWSFSSSFGDTPTSSSLLDSPQAASWWELPVVLGEKWISVERRWPSHRFPRVFSAGCQPLKTSWGFDCREGLWFLGSRSQGCDWQESPCWLPGYLLLSACWALRIWVFFLLMGVGGEKRRCNLLSGLLSVPWCCPVMELAGLQEASSEIPGALFGSSDY